MQPITPIYCNTITAAQIAGFIKKRHPFTHKGSYGHAMLITGSYGKMGAAVLASKACLRSGVGALTTHVPICGYTILQTSIPDAMLVVDVHEQHIATSQNVLPYKAIGIGPGIGTHLDTAAVVKQVLQQSKVPVVVDADALNSIAAHPHWLQNLPAATIFTPHPKEFERLVGTAVSADNQWTLQMNFSKQHQVYVVLKNHATTITCPDGSCFINSTGNAGMAKAGNGDVLTGIITALLAQGYTCQQACIAGVYLHGKAGDIAAATFGEYALLASDTIEHIGNAFSYIINLEHHDKSTISF